MTTHHNQKENGAIAEAIELLASKMPYSDDLRTDHPLMGQTFDDLVQAILENGKNVRGGLSEIAVAISELARAVRDRG